MLGIDDPLIWLAYLLCGLASLGCVVYGWMNWNRGDETLRDEDARWAATEDKIEEEL